MRWSKEALTCLNTTTEPLESLEVLNCSYKASGKSTIYDFINLIPTAVYFSIIHLTDTVNDKSFTVRKLSWFSQIFIKPRKFFLLNFCSSESSDMYEGGDGKNRKTFPRIPDEPSKLRNFSPSKLLSFTVYSNRARLILHCLSQKPV